MKHVVVGIISRKNNQGELEYLLVSSKRIKDAKYAEAYYPPGGHLEQGEDETFCLIREIKEELNLDIEPIKKIAETPGDIPNQTTHWWECKVTGGIWTIDKEELLDAQYFTRQQIKDLKLWPATQQFLEEYIFNTQPHENH